MKQAKANETVHAFLQHNRYDPQDRDGWFSMFEITQGLREDLAIKISLVRVARSLTFLQEESFPPRVEDTWMLSEDTGTPILSQRYSHPDQPEKARRFYRAIETSTEYFKPE